MKASKTSRRLLAVFLAFVMSLTCIPEALAAEKSASAVTMQLAKTEGTVEVSNSSGKKITLIKNMRLRSGYKVATEEASYAWTNLDSTKLVKLDAVSEMSIRKSGKKLELLLDSGNIFFNVTEPLSEDESLNIRTSTMVVGIRGTSGWVRITDPWTAEISILDGTVAVSVTDPVTGETKTDTVTAGETAVCKVNNQEHSDNKCGITRDRYSAEDIDGFVLVELDAPLREKIENASGLDLSSVDAAERLKADQEEVHQKLEQIEAEAARQDSNISTEKVWANPQPDAPATKPSTSGGSSIGSVPNPTPTPTPTPPPTPGASTITFDANGGTVTPTSAQTGADGKLASLPVPVREGYAFDGWFTSATGGIQIAVSYAFTTNTTVYAHWTQNASEEISGEAGANVRWSYNRNTRTLTISGTGPMAEYSWNTGDSGSTAPWSAYRTEIENLIIENGVTTAGTSAFRGCTNLKGGVTLPDSITKIMGSSFANCRSLTSVTIPASATIVGNSAFDGCTGLKDVYYGGTEAQWKAISVFPNNEPMLNANLHFQNSELNASGKAGDNVFWEYTISTRTLRIWGSGPMADFVYTEEDGYSVPWGTYTTEIQSAAIESSVTTIGACAFGGSTNLTSVSIPNSVASIGNGAFQGCSSLTGMTIPDSVTSIGHHAFSGCGGLTGITLPNRIENIKMDTFEGCVGLTNVSIPDGVTYISDNAFFGCTGLTAVSIPNSVTHIGVYAFSRCSSLSSVTIPDSVTGIQELAFSDCSSLTSVTIPVSVTTFLDGVFSGCNSLTDVYYGGTETLWNDITRYVDSSDPLFNATIHYNSTRSIVSNSAPGYVDVPTDAWYAEAVRYCQENGLINGTSDTEFSPDGTLTRAMMVTVLHRLAGKPAAASEAAFADVPAGKWYAEAVSWANSEQIVQGYGNGLFGADDPVTHGQVQLIFQRYSGDSSVQTIGADTPDAPATRAEIAATLMAFAKKSELAPGTLSVFSAMNIMCSPSGLAADRDGSLLVTDVYHKQVWRVVNRASESYAGGATVQDLYGQPVGGYNDAGLDGSYFKQPWVIAPFLDGWAVSDTENNVVRLIQGGSVQTINGATSEKLTVTELGVAFNHPTGLAADDEGNLYVSDTFSGSIRKITPKGGVSTVAKNLSEPMGLCWKDGTLYVAETGKDRVVKIQDGKVSTVASGFDAPQGVAVGDDGSVYVSDTGNGAVRVVKDGKVTTIAARDIASTDAGLTSPVGLLVRDGQLYICDTFARKVFVYQIG